MKRVKKALAAIMLITVAFSIVGCNNNSKNNPEFVDLGLPSGTLWATFNVGTDKPEGYGDYFAWGEIEPKKTYKSSTYDYCECEGSRIHLTKYCVDPDFLLADGGKGFKGNTDNLTILEAIDDAAAANWGSDWCIPTEEQWRELIDNTTYKRTTQKGVNGRLLTSKKNGRSIFLPAAGNRIDSKREGRGGHGAYWSSSLNTCDPTLAWRFWFESSGGYAIIPGVRSCGLSVRPVRSGCNGHAYVDLGLPSGTLWATCNVGAATPETYGNYYAWGGTTLTCNWSEYKHVNSHSNYFNGQLTKYCNDPRYGYNGFTDNLTVLLPEDDVATANWGSDWCIPTKAQWDELKNYTTNEWTSRNCVSGMLFTAKNGQTLFLPAAGYIKHCLFEERGTNGHYWSNSLNKGKPSNALYIYFRSDFYKMLDDERCLGFSVRAVRTNVANEVGNVESQYVQDTPTEVLEYWGALRKDASSYRFTENDLSPLTAKELTYLRNSVYAKHGCVFKSQELNNYFKQFGWYRPDSSVTDAALNSVERANVDFVLNYQKQNGKTYEPQ